MTEKHVRADFVPGHGQFSTPAGDAYAFTGTTGPYEYILGGMCGCLFSTFEDIAKEQGLAYELVTFQVDGVKRDEVPSFLRSVHVHVSVRGTSDPKAFTYWFGEATKRCSAYQTLARVAEMSWDIEFAS